MPTTVRTASFNRLPWRWHALLVVTAFLCAYLLFSFSRAVPARRLRPAGYFYSLSFTRTTFCFSQVFQSACTAAWLSHAVHLHARDAGFMNSRLEGPYRSAEEAAQHRAETIAQHTRKGHFIRGDHIFLDECP